MCSARALSRRSRCRREDAAGRLSTTICWPKASRLLRDEPRDYVRRRARRKGTIQRMGRTGYAARR